MGAQPSPIMKKPHISMKSIEGVMTSRIPVTISTRPIRIRFLLLIRMVRKPEINRPRVIPK